MALVAQYLFNGNGNDETGNYNATSEVDIQYEDAPHGYRFGKKVAVFNGESSIIYLPTITPIFGSSKAYTFEYWYKLHSYINANMTFSTNSPSNGQEIGLLHNGAGFSQVTWGANSTYVYDNALNVWNHLVFIKPANAYSSMTKLYKNGIFVPMDNCTNPTQLLNSTPSQCLIGYRQTNKTSYFSGALSNFRIYDEVLSAETILEHYHSECLPPQHVTANPEEKPNTRQNLDCINKTRGGGR